jgi:hypothetical protein
MSTDGRRRGGLLGPLCAVQRAVVEGGVGLQREIADRLLDRIEAAEDASRRRRLAAHYAAVQAVDRIEDAHPDEEASLDALYDGVGRTFDVAGTLDQHTNEFATRTVENTVGLSERASDAYLATAERGCLSTRRGDRQPERPDEDGPD